MVNPSFFKPLFPKHLHIICTIIKSRPIFSWTQSSSYEGGINHCELAVVLSVAEARNEGINHPLYVHYAKVFIFLKDFSTHPACLSTWDITPARATAK